MRWTCGGALTTTSSKPSVLARWLSSSRIEMPLDAKNVQLRQVDDERLVARLERGDRPLELRRGRDVELADDRDDGDRAAPLDLDARTAVP